MDIEEAFFKKEDVLSIFLDIKGAFNNVHCDILIKKLADIGVSSKLVKFIKFLTYEKFIHSDGNSTRKLYKGVPQGGVLGPLLYIIYVSKIEALLPPNVKISQYADDTALYIRSKNIEQDIKILELSASIVKDYFSDLGLEFTPKKTVFVHFNKKNIPPGSLEIKIVDTLIKSSEFVKFLGIFYDFKLSFQKHLRYVLEKCGRALNIVKFIRGSWWGADPSSLIIFNKSSVRSIIDFGSFIYYSKSKNCKNKLERLL